jgi:hypothetical protein
MVALQIGYKAGHCTFYVVDTRTGVGVEEQAPTPTGTLPRIFQWYHQQFIPEETTDFDKAVSLRKKPEVGISSSQKNGIGIGLSVSYHLVLASGGDLHFSLSPGTTKFWFSLPSIV